mmetsp:Transcript_32914/g.69270  ORF Transcript_32914/g.69270 Transcript_32914/m.69270 type:complete len:247 (-) Transcript_32914:1202-1942(-)|eukprot:CAMPEP_0172319768 /NCGR_PEP_ID=MMETSP1058-20130122/38640_1 /TAXON_ID=83371 /ORGANISM="Detonula confervacea, Strain CCMP 353" /LENGTH=246 /DNA_ID=CAMNT_0013034889 /DNA_START=60 /DNA_END=800 /DNA_ORIENTATION=-
MSGRKKATKRAPGEFTPSQFATCIEDGLNIHVHDSKLSVAAAEVSAKSSDDDPPTEANASTGKTEESNDMDTTMQAMVGEADVNNEATITNTTSFPRVECTNGGMEALRLYHSAFLAMVSTSLGELESAVAAAAAAAATAASKKGKSSSSTPPIKILNEKDVMTCMEQMGLANLVQRAMASLANDNDKRPASRGGRGPAKKKRKRKDPFADYKGTEEELLAEQERLLSESAIRVQMMNLDQGKSEK